MTTSPFRAFLSIDIRCLPLPQIYINGTRTVRPSTSEVPILVYYVGFEINFEFIEENLIAIGANVRRETGKDVFETDPQLNEWMQRVKKLGGTVETEDDERSKRLEEVNNTPPQNTFIYLSRRSWHREKRERSDGKVLSEVWNELICRTKTIVVAFEGFAEEYCLRATEPSSLNSIPGYKGQ